MASVSKIVLINEESLSASQTSRAKGTERGQKDMVGFLKLSNSAAGDFSLVIEHSIDGNTWSTLVNVGNQAGDGIAAANVTAPIYPNVRAVLTNNAGSADVECSLLYDK